jgi:hypothetical protein
MNIDSVIAQLRSVATVFGQNVAGAATYANGVSDQVWLPRPAAYVLPLDMDGGDNESQTGLWQMVAQRISVVLDIDNSMDRRGQASAAQITDLFYAVCSAILNWRPDWNTSNPTSNRETRGFRFVSGEILLMDRARLQYQLIFALDITITDLDGWQSPYDPLIDVRGTISVNSGTVDVGDLVIFDAPFAAP